MNIIGLFIGVECQVHQLMHSLGAVIDVVSRRPIIDSAGLVGADDEGQRLRLTGIIILVRTINHEV